MFAPCDNARWVRLTYARAQARFAAGETIYFCPCKVVPGGPWDLAAAIDGAGWLERAETYRENGLLWKGSVEKTAWQLALNNWRYYSVPETGNYPHYYVRKERADDLRAEQRTKVGV